MTTDAAATTTPANDGAQTPSGDGQQPSTTPNPGGQSGGAAKSESGRTFTQDEVNSFLAAEKRKLQDSEEIKAGRAAQKRLAELEEAQKSEAEKLTERATKAEQLADQRAAKYRAALIRSSFTAQAMAAGVPSDRIDAAYKLADLSAVEVDEDTDSVSGLDAPIKALPDWLKAPAKPAVPDINAGGGHNQTPDPAAREADLKRRFPAAYR